MSDIIRLPNNEPVNKSCPNCRHDVKLIVKSNRWTGNQFPGCPNWPQCDHTEPIPESLLMEALGQPKLF